MGSREESKSHLKMVAATLVVFKVISHDHFLKRDN
jgi:hypothetical protein